MRRAFSADEPEWMDRPDADPVLLADDLRNLATINRWFGGWTCADFLFRRAFESTDRARPVIIDVCAGGGDLPLRALSGRPGMPCRIIAVDRAASTLRAARAAAHGESRLLLVRADARRLPFRDGSVDAAVSTLAAHHFSGDDAARMLAEMRRCARGFAGAADLVRGRLHLLGAWLLTTLILRNPMTRHDAVLSVRRAFSREEFAALARDAGWPAVHHRRFAWFRHAIWDDPARSGR
jgi:hypothetical protein